MEKHKKIDYVFKSFVMKEGVDQKERELSYLAFVKRDGKEYFDMQRDFEHQGKADQWKEAQKINHASYERRKRLAKRIESFMFDSSSGEYNDCVFLTLTFRNDVLLSTTPKQRRDRVSRYLKSQNAKYVANIDFGAKNEREHYHAIVQSTSLDYQAWFKKNGAIKGEMVKYKNPKSLAKYISKLTNHAIKETTHRQALIYSR